MKPPILPFSPKPSVSNISKMSEHRQSHPSLVIMIPRTEIRIYGANLVLGARPQKGPKYAMAAETCCAGINHANVDTCVTSVLSLFFCRPFLH